VCIRRSSSWRDEQVPHAPVVVCRLPLDEPSVLQPVDDSGHVGGVATELLGQLVHRERTTRLEPPECECLHRRQIVLGRRRDHERTVRGNELEDELPCLLRRRNR
jgi:hypothetical protein